jgi:hypothetical protein
VVLGSLIAALYAFVQSHEEETPSVASPAGPRPRTIIDGERQLLSYEDGTNLDFNASADWVFEGADAGKRVVLNRGQLVADVVPQPDGKPMTVRMPRATIAVIGTRLDLRSTAVADWIALLEGTVRVAVEDGREVSLSAGEGLLVRDGETVKAQLNANGQWCLPVDADVTVDFWRAARTFGRQERLVVAGGPDGRALYVQTTLPADVSEAKLQLYSYCTHASGRVWATDADTIDERHLNAYHAPDRVGPGNPFSVGRQGWIAIPLPVTALSGQSSVLCISSDQWLAFASRESDRPPFLVVTPPTF